MKVLLVNDDGVECPLFLSLLREVRKVEWITEINVVVPAFEKSWIGSAITRDLTLYSEEKEVEGQRVLVIDGTPADCVSIALGCLDLAKPDLVISGLNVGSNAGVVFSHSSGTLSGAKFAALHGVPAVAFSTLVSKEVKTAWNQRNFEILDQYNSLFDRTNEYLLKATKAILEANFLTEEGALAHYCSFNTPISFDYSKAPILSTSKNNRYTSLFEKKGPNAFKHKYRGSFDDYQELLPYEPTLPVDVDELEKGSPVCSCFRVDYDYGNLNLPSNSSERLFEAWSRL